MKEITLFVVDATDLETLLTQAHLVSRNGASSRPLSQQLLPLEQRGN